MVNDAFGERSMNQQIELVRAGIGKSGFGHLLNFSRQRLLKIVRAGPLWRVFSEARDVGPHRVTPVLWVRRKQPLKAPSHSIGQPLVLGVENEKSYF